MSFLLVRYSDPTEFENMVLVVHSWTLAGQPACAAVIAAFSSFI
jgi:hypothetical protein